MLKNQSASMVMSLHSVEGATVFAEDIVLKTKRRKHHEPKQVLCVMSSLTHITYPR